MEIADLHILLLNVGHALFRPNQYMRPTFNPSRPLKKRNKIALWKHNFICLANTYDDLVPSNIAKANLIRAGLGLKEITFSLNGDSSDFHEEILNAFPKLRDSGGYELLRTSDGHSKLLHVIPPLSGGYTAAYLKSIYHGTVQSLFETTRTGFVHGAHY